MRILGIETSCDETAAAVVEKKDGRFKLLGSAVASSKEIHQKYGGIIPEKAAREQLKMILPVIEETLCLSQVNSSKSIKNLISIDCHVVSVDTGTPRNDKIAIQPFNRSAMQFIDAIAVTQGPGLIGSLIVGVEVAKTLSFVLKKPLIPINHLLAHLYVNLLRSPASSRQLPVEFPAVGLIVSGGHTDLLLFKSITNYKWLGGTRDDAAGECFDKCARILALGYPGGAEIEAVASSFKVQGSSFKVQEKLPRPMIKEDNSDFSFSGLKTAVLRKLQGSRFKQQEFISQMAYEIQEAITDVLVKKTIRAAEKYKAKSILCGGGVLANGRLRRKLRQATSYQLPATSLFLPEKKFCTDNAVGIAMAGFFGKEVSWKNLRPNPGLEF